MTRSAYVRAIGLPRVVVALALLLPFGVSAQIRIDSSLGRPAQTLAGPHYLIPETLGRLSGSNLFYSFQTFNINTGESAIFTTVTPNISNVVCRVTGGTPSFINGVLSLTAASGTPSFFFINPSGVTFGAGASIDVPGAFHVSTADYVKFSDGNFYADATKTSTFSSAAPEAFGFLGANRGAIIVRDGATLSSGPLQPLSLTAGDIEINNAFVSTLGGDIRVVALGQSNQEVGLAGPLPSADGNLSILNGGQIYSAASGARDAGNLIVGAGSITINGYGQDPSGTYPSGIFSQRDVNVTATGNLSVVNGGEISSGTHASDNAGTVTVNSRSITIDSQGFNQFGTGIFSQAETGSTGNAGVISVAATDNLSVVNGGQISSGTFSSGNAGTVTVSAGSITIDSQGLNQFATGIFSQANNGSSGNAGDVSVMATGNLSVVNGGQISSSSGLSASGNGGPVTVSAGSITIDGQFNLLQATGILSGYDNGTFNGSGKAGDIHVTATGNLSILNGGQIASSTFYGGGDSGSVTVSAGTLNIDGGGGIGITTGIFSETNGLFGSAGDVNVTVSGNLSVLNAGVISSSTNSYGNAGTVKVVADNITIDAGDAGFVPPGSGAEYFFTGILSQSGYQNDFSYPSPGATFSGNAGRVEVTAKGSLLILGGGLISSDTSAGNGNAGTVTVNAANIIIDGKASNITTGIVSRSFAVGDFNSAGDAGSVNVTATGSLSVLNGATISSSSTASPGSAHTFTGSAGTVTVAANSMLVDGSGYWLGNPSSINASAGPSSTGQTGNVTVTALNGITLSNDGEISIANDAIRGVSSVPTLLTVSAPEINVNGGGQITAASSGNFAASDVLVHFGNRLTLDSGSISTGANNGNGGSINIQGSGVFVLNNSRVTTSVAGLTGNGGDINVSANALVMNTGFIQANTAAQNATGGNVDINVQSLVPSGDSLFVGGQQPFAFQSDVFGFNVIQAAAPTGVNGTVQITTPVLDISGALSGLNAKFIETGGLGRNPCRIEGGSSLVQAGRGGFVPSGRGLLGPPPMKSAKPASDPAVTAPFDPALRFTEMKCRQG